MPGSFDGFCSLWPVANPRVRMRGMHPDIFKIVFDIYNFSITLNLFDSDKPYALSTHNRKRARQYLVKHSESGSKNLNKICLRIIQKALQIAITACKFSKFFRESMPPDPPRAFLVSQSFSNLFCRKKTL